jgi:hypothetical protein
VPFGPSDVLRRPTRQFQVQPKLVQTDAVVSPPHVVGVPLQTIDHEQPCWVEHAYEEARV